MTATASATCQHCDHTWTGTWADVDKAADQHTRKTGHPTTTCLVP